MKKRIEKIEKVQKDIDIPGYTVVFDPTGRKLEKDSRIEKMEIRADFYVAGKIMTDGERTNFDLFAKSLYGKALVVSDPENDEILGFIEIMRLTFQPKKQKPMH